jgi:hypothetical protein
MKKREKGQNMEVNIVQKNGSNKQKLTGKTNNR